MSLISELWNEGWFGRSLLGAFVIVIALIPIAILASFEEARRCEDMGGHIITKTGVGVGPSISPGVGIAVVPTSVSFCVSDDGRILF